jgi:hypothetical protein
MLKMHSCYHPLFKFLSNLLKRSYYIAFCVDVSLVASQKSATVFVALLLPYSFKQTRCCYAGCCKKSFANYIHLFSKGQNIKLPFQTFLKCHDRDISTLPSCFLTFRLFLEIRIVLLDSGGIVFEMPRERHQTAESRNPPRGRSVGYC